MTQDIFNFAINSIRFDEHYQPAENTRLTTNFAKFGQGREPPAELAQYLAHDR